MAGREASPRRSQELIFLDADDDLATIRAKLEASPADDVFLVVPARASVLRTPLEFRILGRLAHELSTDLTIVSSDGQRRYLARQEGLRTRRGYRGVRHLAEAAGAPRGWFGGASDWLPLPSLGSVLTVVAVVIALGAIVLVGLPVMRVTLAPVTQSVQRDIEVVVEPAQRTDATRGLLQGELVRIDRLEVASSVPATGQRNMGREPARGEVIFTNATGSAVTLPARTVVVARTSVRYLTDLEVRVPPATPAGARVAVTAEQRGAMGNVEASQITSLDPPLPGLSVTNRSPFSGGADRPTKVPQQADQQKLRDLLLQRSREQSLLELAARSGPGKSLPPNTLQTRVESEAYQPPLDSEGDTFNGTMTVSATAVAWDNQALNELIRNMLLMSFGPSYELPLGLLQLQPPEVLEAQGQRMRVRVQASALVVHRLDPESLGRELSGQSPEGARAVLAASPGIGSQSRVEITPAWAPRAWRVEVALLGAK